MSNQEARNEFHQDLSRAESDAEKALEGAYYYLTDEDKLVFAFTEKQIEEARQEMNEALTSGKPQTEEIKPEEPKPERFTVNIKGRSIEIPNSPVCDFEQLLEAKHIVESNYGKLISDLPDEHPWKEAKITHEAITKAGSRELLTELSGILKEENYFLLLFLAGVHDLGRPIEAYKKLGIPVDTKFSELKNHGEYSIEALRQWGVLDQFPPETQTIIEYSIAHHSDKNLPVTEEDATDQEKLQYFYTCVFRDMDKLAVMLGKTDQYLFNNNEKNKQTKVNQLQGEQHYINPPAILDTFSRFQPIDRSECQSYEAFMLQYLAWIFDINLPTVLGYIRESGTIDKILSYFHDQLPANQYQQITDTTEKYLQKIIEQPEEQSSEGK